MEGVMTVFSECGAPECAVREGCPCSGDNAFAPSKLASLAAAEQTACPCMTNAGPKAAVSRAFVSAVSAMQAALVSLSSARAGGRWTWAWAATTRRATPLETGQPAVWQRLERGGLCAEATTPTGPGACRTPSSACCPRPSSCGSATARMPTCAWRALGLLRLAWAGALLTHTHQQEGHAEQLRALGNLAALIAGFDMVRTATSHSALLARMTAESRQPAGGLCPVLVQRPGHAHPRAARLWHHQRPDGELAACACPGAALLPAPC